MNMFGRHWLLPVPGMIGGHGPGLHESRVRGLVRLCDRRAVTCRMVLRHRLSVTVPGMKRFIGLLGRGVVMSDNGGRCIMSRVQRTLRERKRRPDQKNDDKKS
jgi:hypothetical protein